MPRLKLAVLLTGSGTTLENLFEQSASGVLNADVVVVGSSRSDAFGMERARRRNVPVFLVEKRLHRDIDTEFRRLHHA